MELSILLVHSKARPQPQLPHLRPETWSQPEPDLVDIKAERGMRGARRSSDSIGRWIWEPFWEPASNLAPAGCLLRTRRYVASDLPCTQQHLSKSMYQDGLSTPCLVSQWTADVRAACHVRRFLGGRKRETRDLGSALAIMVDGLTGGQLQTAQTRLVKREQRSSFRQLWSGRGRFDWTVWPGHRAGRGAYTIVCMY